MKRIKRRIESNNEGSIGVGSLIVFIAMVLIAAVAASVMIDYMNSLQQHAKSTGQETTNNIAPPIEVQRISANVSDGQADQIQMYITLVAGRDAYNIERNLVVSFEGSDNEPSPVGFSNKFVHVNNTNPADLPTFNATSLTNSTNQGLPFLSDNSVIQLTFSNLDEGASEIGENGLSPGSSLSIYFMSSDGGTGTLYETRTPSSYPDSGWVSLI